ncbi:hypothetical protein, partial [Henriciella pelagia]|uniref:hypothetical protein n=1 Tax=Henriciella pelagia TaxID=1977912 RepID=UPI003F494E77
GLASSSRKAAFSAICQKSISATNLARQIARALTDIGLSTCFPETALWGRQTNANSSLLSAA